MSHFVNYAIAFNNKNHIKKALTEMGYEVVENTAINGWRGMQMPVAIAGIKTQKNEIGFQMNDKTGTYDAVADWMYVPNADKVRDRLSQLNAKYNVEDALKKARFSAKVTEENGEFVIIGTR